MDTKELFKITGEYRIFKEVDGVYIPHTDWFNNIVVSSDTYGRNLIIRALTNDTTYPIFIDGMVLSTDSTPPTNADTSWGGTEVLTLISVWNPSNNVLNMSAFFSDGNLPNGTYPKLGLAMNGRIFTSALLPSALVKNTLENYRIDVRLTIN
jgi:hypothetical protein